jgi:hypothetical protein
MFRSSSARDTAQIVRVTHKRGLEQGDALIRFPSRERKRHSARELKRGIGELVSVVAQSCNLAGFNICSPEDIYSRFYIDPGWAPI